MDRSDQIGSIAILGAVAAAVVLALLLLFWLVRILWRWVAGTHRQDADRQKRETRLELARPEPGVGVSASDLFIIRSNLDAVSRQVEDLERRLRLETGARTKDVVPSGD